MNVYTIGFTKTSAETFFDLINTAGVLRVIDVRLNNVSQLAGFAKRNDLEYFLRTICNVEYIHEPQLAPTPEMLRAYQRKEMTWDVYAARYLDLLETRRVETHLDAQALAQSCLLCSEHSAVKCHRRLALDYLRGCGTEIQVHHLQ